MAKTLAKIAANKNLLARVKELEEECRHKENEIQGLIARCSERKESNDRNYEVGMDWKKHYEAEKKETASIRCTLERAQEELNRCLGWIDSRLGTHPIERYRREQEGGAMPPETDRCVTKRPY